MDNKFSTTKERILQLLEYKGVVKDKFFNKIGMTYGSFKGDAKKTPINSVAIENIFAEFPDISLEWLLTGNGEMIKTTNQTIEKPETIYVSKSQREKDLELTIKVQQELIDSLKNRLRQYEEGVQDVGVAGVG